METALSRFGRVRIYESMAAQLWERGETTSALALEELWHQLSRRLAFELVCIYTPEALDAAGSEEDRQRLGEMHDVA